MGVIQIKPRWNHEDGVVVMEMQPVGTANAKQKNRPKRAVFLLSFANFGLKTGGEKSYAPRVRLLGIFVRTRDLITHIATV